MVANYGVERAGLCGLWTVDCGLDWTGLGLEWLSLSVSHITVKQTKQAGGGLIGDPRQGNQSKR
jgi:hypothetical protein